MYVYINTSIHVSIYVGSIFPSAFPGTRLLAGQEYITIYPPDPNTLEPVYQYYLKDFKAAYLQAHYILPVKAGPGFCWFPLFGTVGDSRELPIGGSRELTTLWSHNPHVATIPCTSNRPRMILVIFRAVQSFRKVVSASL